MAAPICHCCYPPWSYNYGQQKKATLWKLDANSGDVIWSYDGIDPMRSVAIDSFEQVYTASYGKKPNGNQGYYYTVVNQFGAMVNIWSDEEDNPPKVPTGALSYMPSTGTTYPWVPYNPKIAVDPSGTWFVTASYPTSITSAAIRQRDVATGSRTVAFGPYSNPSIVAPDSFPILANTPFGAPIQNLFVDQNSLVIGYNNLALISAGINGRVFPSSTPPAPTVGSLSATVTIYYDAFKLFGTVEGRPPGTGTEPLDFDGLFLTFTSPTSPNYQLTRQIAVSTIEGSSIPGVSSTANLTFTEPFPNIPDPLDSFVITLQYPSASDPYINPVVTAVTAMERGFTFYDFLSNSYVTDIPSFKAATTDNNQNWCMVGAYSPNSFSSENYLWKSDSVGTPLPMSLQPPYWGAKNSTLYFPPPINNIVANLTAVYTFEGLGFIIGRSHGNGEILTPPGQPNVYLNCTANGLLPGFGGQSGSDLALWRQYEFAGPPHYFSYQLGTILPGRPPTVAYPGITKMVANNNRVAVLRRESMEFFHTVWMFDSGLTLLWIRLFPPSPTPFPNDLGLFDIALDNSNNLYVVGEEMIAPVGNAPSTYTGVEQYLDGMTGTGSYLS